MKLGVEVDFIVKDSLKALALYESIFPVERVEITDLPKGQNEAVFTIYGTRFHMLDENAEFGMFAPKDGVQPSIWFNVMVPDINLVHGKAVESGCIEIQPITAMMGDSVSNSMFMDSFGYLWMLHEIHREMSLEERMKYFEEGGK